MSVRATLNPLTAWMCLFVAGCGGAALPQPASMSSTAAPGSPPAAHQGGAFLERTASAEAGGRAYRLYVPEGYDGSRVVPLLVMLHGCTQDAADFAAGTRMNERADEHTFLALYPEQPAGAHPQKCWNWYLPEHQRRYGGEAAEIAMLAREVMREHRVDEARVYVAGVSAGGAMAAILAATHPDLVAAFAAHSGIMYGAAHGVEAALQAMRGAGPDPVAAGDAAYAAMGEHARAVPALFFQGAADPVVNVSNFESLTAQWLRIAERAGAAATTPAVAEEIVTVGGRSATRGLYSDTDGRPLLERWIVEDLGHAWSGGSTTGTYADPAGPDASREIVRFLLQHSLLPRRDL
jgi:poly(hydroxyalkanoate) depolymerase family esterase